MSETAMGYKTSDFWYDLPEELIAQTPLEQRDSSRLLVLDRESGTIDSVTIRLKELLGMKSSSSPYLKDGVAPHIWVNGNDASWYGFTPSSADYSRMREAVTDYVAIFQEPVMEQAPQEHHQSM